MFDGLRAWSSAFHFIVGQKLITGEADVMRDPRSGRLFFYFNDWGGCAGVPVISVIVVIVIFLRFMSGVDCCDTPSGCASCCFAGSMDPCVYTNNHSVVVYSTIDLMSWKYEGIALQFGTYVSGIEFRPHVVYNRKNNQYVMW